MALLTVVPALLSLSIGVGAISRLYRPLAVVVIGLVVPSILLTLIVLPAAYSLMAALAQGPHTVPCSASVNKTRRCHVPLRC